MRHFEHTYPNGVTVGYVDGRLGPKDDVPDYETHYSNCYDARVALGHKILKPSNAPDKQIRIATVDTHYSTYYRIVKKKYFLGADAFPRNWEDNDRKLSTNDRYSPKGTVGHYLSVSFDAAMDEMLYRHGDFDGSDYTLLAIESYFSNILYLADYAVLATVCDLIPIKYDNPLDLMNAILNPETANAMTDRIGLWARDRGLDGLVYPTARYAQQQDLQRNLNAGQPVFPMMNRLGIGCRMDMLSSLDVGTYWQLLGRQGIDHPDDYHVIYADLNVVLFSGRQLQGEDRAVFWQACSLESAHLLLSLDQRPSTASTVLYSDKGGAHPHPKPRSVSQKRQKQ
jgi:hypothetical protein